MKIKLRERKELKFVITYKEKKIETLIRRIVKMTNQTTDQTTSRPNDQVDDGDKQKAINFDVVFIVVGVILR